MAFAEPLSDDKIERRLSQLDGWTRMGDEISKTFEHTYHECVHLAMYVAAKAREVWESPGHRHPVAAHPVRDHHARCRAPDHGPGFRDGPAHRRDSGRARGEACTAETSSCLVRTRDS
jgi:hypothetical protein